MWNRTTKAGVAIGLGLGMWLASIRDASAYCRTTTCDPARGETCRKNDRGCVRDGVPIKWKASPIVYRFHRAGSAKLDDDDMRDAVREAFDAWASVECGGGPTSLRFEEGQDIDDDKPLGDVEASEKFGIYFRDDEWPHDNAGESLALTTQSYGKESGNIDYADIEVNTADNRFQLSGKGTGIDFQAVMTHEVGHYIGLAHSDDSESIMVGSYCQSEDRCGGSVAHARALSDDDRDAVCVAYPPTKAAAPAASSCAVPASGIDAPPLGAAVSGFGILFMSAAVVRRRLRARLEERPLR